MNKLIFSIIFCALLVCLVISKESELNKRGISVAGGTDIDYDNQFPHLVSLQYSRDGVKYQHFCGGSVIASRWILTAAHCLSVDGMDVSKVRVLAGVANQDIDCSNPSSKCVIGKVKRKLVHPNYNSQYIRNDIAMLELTSDLPLGTASQNRVQRIGIEGGQIPFKTLVTLTGWGRTSDASNDLPSKAQKAYMPLQQASVCNDQGLGMETPYQLCVGEGNRINSCQGDSGGPLHWIRQSGNSYTMGLIGLVSYGPQGCGRQGAFGVYTNTTYWINYVKNYVPDLQVVYMNGGGTTNPTNPSNPSNPGTCNCAAANNNNQEQSVEGIELPKVIKIA